MLGPETLKNFMEKNGIRGDFIFLRASEAKTSVSAANSVGCSVSQIAKNVVLKGSKPYLVILSGDRRVDLKRASMTAGEKLALMESSEVLEHTGFPVGGVPPFGHLKTIKTWVDRSVTRFGVIYTSGGSDSVLLKIEVSELLRFIKAPIVDISI